MSFAQSLIEDHEFVTDFARYSEGLMSEAVIRKKYRFDETTWERLGVDDALIEAVEAEKARRIRSGEAKREKAQQHIVKAPDVLNGIMSDPKANAKHRIDSAKVVMVEEQRELSSYLAGLLRDSSISALRVLLSLERLEFWFCCDCVAQRRLPGKYP